MKKNIYLVSNRNTIDFKKMKKENPAMYNYHRMETSLYNDNVKLQHINEDKNNVYAKVVKKGKSSSIFSISKTELKRYNLEDKSNISRDIENSFV